jgi:hypothetical protein
VHPGAPSVPGVPSVPGIPSVACILNGRGQPAQPESRRSRGELPLLAAAQGPKALAELHDDPDSLKSYDPFHLLHADRGAAMMLSWDGEQARLTGLEPATHVLTNAGHAYPPGQAGPSDPKAAYFGPKFAARRPSGDPAETIKNAWGDWLTLSAGDGLPLTDPAAIIARRELPDGRIWGSTSLTLIALGAEGIRYDFQPVPADPATWYPV